MKGLSDKEILVILKKVRAEFARKIKSPNVKATDRVGFCHLFYSDNSGNNRKAKRIVDTYLEKYRDSVLYDKYMPYWFNPTDRKIRLDILDCEIENLTLKLNKKGGKRKMKKHPGQRVTASDIKREAVAAGDLLSVMVGRRKWRQRGRLSLSESEWTANYYCRSDNDGITLYINLRSRTMTLFCFSGIENSHIYLDELDYHSMMASQKLEHSDSFILNSLRIADSLCRKFCEYKN